jgi:hypothetical protein
MTTDMMKREAKVLRECADKIEALDGFGRYVDDLRATANTLDPKPTIDRSLRGWVMVTTPNGTMHVDWADDEGLSALLSDGVGGGLFTSWGNAEKNQLTVEPFPTGYSEAEVQHVLERTGASASTVGNALCELRRLKEDR